ncbi:MAG: uroporphyrinogen decarboxylase family protein [Planctomycetota bacterium]
MSYEDGWAALNLEMPPRVPRTEYSAGKHWDLIKAVTGIDVSLDSDDETKHRAQQAFFRTWNFDLFWNVGIGRGEFGDLCTDMGHAEYAAGGVDRRDTVRCPFNDPEEVLSFDPWQAYGRRDRAELVYRFEQHYRNQMAGDPIGVRMTGVYTTLMSGLIDIFGWEMLLLAAGTDLKRFGDLADRYASWIGQYYDALGDADVPVVMVHDDIVWTSGAFLHPDWYRRYVFPNYRKLFAPLVESGKRILYTSDGNYTEFIDDIAATGVNGFVLEPTTDMAYIAEHYGRTHAFIGNVDTRVLLRGTRKAIRTEVERCMDIGKDCPGFFLAVGNHIPANTPVDSALYYNEVYEELSRR